MAHLDPTTETAADTATTRGQLFLIGALALAMAFVALTLLLNTAIYAENLAARGTNVGGTDIQGVLNSIQNHATDTMRHVNYDQSGQTSDFVATVQTWESMVADRYGSGGMLVDITVNSTTAGSRLEQDEVRNFSSPSGGQNWTLVSGTPHSRDFTMNVSYAGLSSSQSGAYTIVLDGGTTTMTVYQHTTNDQEVNVTVDAPWGTNGCHLNEKRDGTNDGYVRINVTDGQLGGHDCAPLARAFANVSDSYAIAYENADSVRGTWKVIVPQGTVNSGVSWGPQPYHVDAVYSAALIVSFADQSYEYRDTVRVAPGEHP